MTKQELIELIKSLPYNASEISKETSIPAPRIRKWREGKGLPKATDFEILLAWVNSKKMPSTDNFELKDDGPFYRRIETDAERIAGLEKLVIKCNQKYWELEEINKELIEDLQYVRELLKKCEAGK